MAESSNYIDCSHHNFTAAAAAATGNSDGNFFENICNNVTAAILLAHDTVLKVLQLSNELVKHDVPTSLQLHVILVSSTLQRNFLNVKLQVDELLRLTKLYSVPWEQRNENLNILHKQYNSKQTRLEIALKKIEHLSNVNHALERRHTNYEKIFIKLTSSTSDAEWKQTVQLLQDREAISFVGKSVQGLKRPVGANKSEYYLALFSNSSSELNADFGVNDSVADNNLSDARATSNHDDEGAFLEAQSYSDKISIPEWKPTHGSNTHRVLDGNRTHTFPRTSEKAVQTILNVDIQVDKEVQASLATSDKSSTTIQWNCQDTFHLRISRPECLSKYGDLLCKVAVNDSLFHLDFAGGTVNEGENTWKIIQHNFQRSFEAFGRNDKDGEFNNHGNTKLKISFRRATDNQTILAFCSYRLSELIVPISVSPKYAAVNELTLLSTINKNEFELYEPCGKFHVECHLSQHYVEPYVDRTTQISPINKLAGLFNNSACIETKRDTDYSDKDLESFESASIVMKKFQEKYEDENDALLLSRDYSSEVQLKARATTPISFHMDTEYHSPSVSPGGKRQEKLSGNKLRFSEKWGKDLPGGFLTRLNIFSDASQHYHERLKSKTKEAVDLQVTRRLEAEKKMSHNQNPGETSVYANDVYLPAIFMPIKSNQSSSTRNARSYIQKTQLTHPVPLFDKLPDHISRYKQQSDGR